MNPENYQAGIAQNDLDDNLKMSNTFSDVEIESEEEDYKKGRKNKSDKITKMAAGEPIVLKPNQPKNVKILAKILTYNKFAVDNSMAGAGKTIVLISYKIL